MQKPTCSVSNGALIIRKIYHDVFAAIGGRRGRRSRRLWLRRSSGARRARGVNAVEHGAAAGLCRICGTGHIAVAIGDQSVAKGVAREAPAAELQSRVGEVACLRQSDTAFDGGAGRRKRVGKRPCRAVRVTPQVIGPAGRRGCAANLKCAGRICLRAKVIVRRIVVIRKLTIYGIASLCCRCRATELSRSTAILHICTPRRRNIRTCNYAIVT